MFSVEEICCLWFIHDWYCWCNTFEPPTPTTYPARPVPGHVVQPFLSMTQAVVIPMHTQKKPQSSALYRIGNEFYEKVEPFHAGTNVKDLKRESCVHL